MCTVEEGTVVTPPKDGEITSVEDAPSVGDMPSSEKDKDSDEETSAVVEGTTFVSGGVVEETCAEDEKTTSVEDTTSVAEAVVGSPGADDNMISVGTAEDGAGTRSNKLNALGPPQISSGFPAQGILQFGDPSVSTIGQGTTAEALL